MDKRNAKRLADANKAGDTVQALTANRLSDGIVVYLDGQGGWTEDMAKARFAEDDETLQQMQGIADKAVADRLVVEVYPIGVMIEDEGPVALSVRERIRAAHKTTLTKDWYDVPL
ncbi:DUF2849 domain-containing protein [Methyloligella sp. 2.7D]|uniref:DUF2849 domain-containing protein n=1 Tax=unclassified Methyloligella TaxID=2625955 RepID=UPI00157E21F1|nr:DUF2849 domain-containing protein [Methyloligella sp. GL2]QKP78474.1 DUF2849 domain-containing protein [Methyloligella sp. GL2]